MTDQVRTIDNKRLLRKLGELPENLAAKVRENLAIILDLKKDMSGTTLTCPTPLTIP